MDQCARAPSHGFSNLNEFNSLNGKEEEQMSDLHSSVGPRQMIEGMKQWWRNWRGAGSRLTELACCGEYEVERMARDLGMPSSELRKIANRGPDAADLLLRRMAELNLDGKEVAATAPGTFQDLQRLCTLCESHRQCARDLGRDPADKAWEDYCPNVATLKLLDSLPWTSRSEW
jgi:hypothetical protein